MQIIPPLPSNRFAEFGKRYRCEGEGGDGQPLIYIEHGHIEFSIRSGGTVITMS